MMTRANVTVKWSIYCSQESVGISCRRFCDP